MRQGQCTFTYTGPSIPTVDVITGRVDSGFDTIDAVGRVRAVRYCGEATKAWILPASTPGQVTGGGYILDPADGERRFGFNALSTANGIEGNCTVVDAAPVRNVKIKCITVTTLVRRVQGEGPDLVRAGGVARPQVGPDQQVE